MFRVSGIKAASDFVPQCTRTLTLTHCEGNGGTEERMIDTFGRQSTIAYFYAILVLNTSRSKQLEE